MSERSTGHDATARHGPDLAVLVETEARLDRAIAEARASAAAMRAEAERQADLAMAALDAELARERARAAAAIADQTAARLRAIDAETRAAVAGFAAIEGERLAQLGRRLGERVAALALTDDEAAP